MTFRIDLSTPNLDTAWLGLTLHQQAYESNFDSLSQRIGRELVAILPKAPVQNCIGDYPKPWGDPSELPADAVKGKFLDGRTFLALRFIDAKVDANEQILEVFFERHSMTKPAVLTTLSHGNVVTKDKIVANINISSQSLPEEDYSNNWVSSSYKGRIICTKPAMTKEFFSVIQHILQGSSLQLTDGRYLPLYRDRVKEELDASGRYCVDL